MALTDGLFAAKPLFSVKAERITAVTPDPKARMRSASPSGKQMSIPIDDADDPRIEAFRLIRERDLVGRDGRFIAEGKVVLRVLLAQMPEQLEALLVLENRMQGLEDVLARLPGGIPVYAATANVMDAIAGFHMHRGVLGIARRRPDSPVSEFLAQPPPDALIVVLSGISNHDNMGAIFRNAAVFEADAVIVDGQCCDPFYRKSIRVSVGAVLQVPVFQASSLSGLCADLTAAGFQLGALSPKGSASIERFAKTGRRALILGAEGGGLPESILHAVPSFKIPMSEAFDSLNVATASGIALYHASRFSAPFDPLP